MPMNVNTNASLRRSPRLFRQIPIMALCFVSHMTGFVVALTIGKHVIPYMVCASIGMACIAIGMAHDIPPNK